MDTKVYEFAFLLNGRLAETEAVALFDKLENIFSGFEAKVIKKSNLERKFLAYPIKKEGEAYFGYFQLELDPEKVAEIKEKFRYENGILRHLCLTPPPNFGKMTNVGGKQKAKEAKEKKGSEGAPEAAAEATNKKEEIDLEGLDQKLEEIEDLA
ncbi:MAG TPA: 30S ribosomal protein S6 [Candidatus Paceibacterota bacterium]|nr:30S ribosomal protein S6 [Candidatus Paceibacterota bacterium]HRY77011.1 30S ribosomal protein S6 [Candidatus Paceibacterota bacterium]